MKLDTKMSVATAPKRNSFHWQQGEVSWGQIAGWLDTPDSKKEAGNYFLGTLRETTETHKKGDAPCTGLHRNNRAVVNRSAITLDADSPRADLPDVVSLVLPCAAIVHTTYSSSPDDLRFRIIIPIDRALLPDEYHVAVSALMDLLGPDQFDKGSVEPARYMFKPAAQEPGWFQSWVIDGPALAVDPLLEGWDPDLSSLPTPKPSRNKRDPFTLEGVVGAFNRAYEDWQTVIDEYELPYEPQGDGDRWSLTGSASVAGMGIMGPGLVYSHHVTDPAYGQACSAFDLVRLHRFGHLDTDMTKPVNRRPSHTAMMDLAAEDRRVMAERAGMAAEDFADIEGSFEDAAVWKLELKYENKTDKLVDTIRNWDLVCGNDAAFEPLLYNEFTLAVEISGDLPWRDTSTGTTFDSSDFANMSLYLERSYGVRLADTLVNKLVITTARRTYVNPVRDYLDGLVWDGRPRVETALPGVQPTAYTRMVARKCLVAAVARVYEPGIKWDHTLVLYGLEGLGKSHWIERLALGKYSASLGRIGDKDTLLTMQRNWIMTSDEGYSLKKADADVQKEFLTRTVDTFRAPYDSRPMAYPRHCVIWGTTNDEVFLRRQEGNRRFLIVRCEGKVDFDAMTPEYVGQLWAEAVHLYRAGEKLYLDDDQSIVANMEREEFIEEDALEGVLQEYLELPVPGDWETMSSESRRAWAESYHDGLQPGGDSQQQRTCSAQLYVEALGRRFGDHRRSELLDINTALKRVPGWAPLPGRHRVPGYGPQQVFVRIDEDTQRDLDDVI